MLVVQAQAEQNVAQAREGFARQEIVGEIERESAAESPQLVNDGVAVHVLDGGIEVFHLIARQHCIPSSVHLIQRTSLNGVDLQE